MGQVVPLESAITKRITTWLTREGIWWMKTFGGGRGRMGIPDLLLCYRGRFVAMEVKRPLTNSKPSVHQKRELAAIQKSDGVAVIVRSLEEVKDELLRIDLHIAEEECVPHE